MKKRNARSALHGVSAGKAAVYNTAVSTAAALRDSLPSEPLSQSAKVFDTKSFARIASDREVVAVR